MLLVPISTARAAKVSFLQFCQALAGEWRGSSAGPNDPPLLVTVTGVCSADNRQLMLSVSQNAQHPFSETWWFRDKGEQVLLTYFDGVDEDKQQLFSLYLQNGDYSLLGEGQLSGRPALIQLLFETHNHGWQWRQNAQYLDDDSERYRLFRGIEMQPSAAASH